jgi:hypothetical protein
LDNFGQASRLIDLGCAPLLRADDARDDARDADPEAKYGCKKTDERK